MFTWLKSMFSPPREPKPVEDNPNLCNHLYFPVMDGDKPLGQRCALCHKFNSFAEVQDTIRSQRIAAALNEK